MVFSGLVTAWRFATCPTSREPSLLKATTEGVVLAPSSLVSILGSPFSMTATTELVVPKSIPMIFPILHSYIVITSLIWCNILKRQGLVFGYIVFNFAKKARNAAL